MSKIKGPRTKQGMLAAIGVKSVPFSSLPRDAQKIARSIDRNSVKKMKRKKYK